MYPLFTALPLMFSKRLEDQANVFEEEDIGREKTIALQVKITKKGSTIKWFLDGKRLNVEKGDKKYELRVQGLVSTLQIKNPTPAELGEYSATYAEDKTACLLGLKGNVWLITMALSLYIGDKTQ